MSQPVQASFSQSEEVFAAPSKGTTFYTDLDLGLH